MSLTLNVLLGVAVLAIYLIKFPLSHIPEPFSGGKNTGDIVFELCISYIGAYIFWFVNIYAPQKKAAKHVLPIVADATETIISRAMQPFIAMRDELNIESNLYKMDKSAIKKILAHPPYANANVFAWANGNIQQLNWLQYMLHSQTTVRETYERITPYIGYIDPILARSLYEVYNTFYYQVISPMVDLPIQSQDMQNLVDFVYPQIQNVRKLQDVYDSKLKKYSNVGKR